MQKSSAQKIVQLCTLDSGGAGKAALRLNSGLRSMGIDSTVVVALKQSKDPAVAVLEPGEYGAVRETNTEYGRVLSTLTGHWGELVAGHPGRPKGQEMFSDTKTFFRLENAEQIRTADIIHFHWITGFFDCSKTLSLLKGKKIIWTIHDMNPFTGGCHYAGGCEKYKHNCGACPQLGSSLESDLSRQVWEQKREAYKNLDITVVTPSRWMAECASASSLFEGFPVLVIPNGIPTDIFRPMGTNTIRKGLNIPENAKVILFGADHLMNSRKGFVFLLEALQSYRPTLSDCPIYLAVFGKLEPGLTISSDYQVLNFGSLTNEEDVASLYSLADVFVLPSLEDNLPNTVLEAMACGTPVVGFDIGGIPDMISHKVNGFLACPRDVTSLAEGIDWCLFGCDRNTIAHVCREWVMARYTLQTQGARYADLYKKLSEHSTIYKPTQRRDNSLVTVATSIAPKEIEKQQSAIATWLHLGISVLSVNNTDEIEILKPCFPEVNFVPAARNAQEIAGKPLIFFDDILKALSGSGSKVCGIINSDIHLRTDEHFPEFIAQESRNSFVYGSRIDVTSIEDTAGTEFSTGFDFFFFDPAVIDLYPQTDFAIGATWWDYWAVIVPLLRHYTVKKLISPVAFHIDHAKNWSPEQWRTLGGLFSSYLSELGFVFSTVDLQSSAFTFLDYVDFISPKLMYGPSEASRPAPGSYLVSALVSTYNSEKFLRGCLQNLLDQTLYKQGQLEIIIINSGSQQNEGAIAREFIYRFPQHVVYVHTERETLYEAWNRGVALAHGRYLTHANTDDRHRSDAFEVMARTLDLHNVGLVYVDALITQIANETFDNNSATKYWLLPDFNIRQALLDCPFGCQVMWRASAHADVGMFDGSYKRAGDYEFFLRLALQQGALHIPEILVLYHESMSNLSYESPREVTAEIQRFIRSYRKDIKLEAIYPYLLKDSSSNARIAALVDFANHLCGISQLFTDYTIAAMYYRQALELCNWNKDIIGNLATALILDGKMMEAIEILRSLENPSPMLSYYLDALDKGEAPKLTLINIEYPGLASMKAVKPLTELRVPIANVAVQRLDKTTHPFVSKFELFFQTTSQMKKSLVFYGFKKLPYPNLGVAYLVANLRKHNFDWDYQYLDYIEDLSQVAEIICKYRPAIVGLSATSFDFLKVIELGNRIKTAYNPLILLGGAHITSVPQTLPKCVDIGFLGEAEETIIDIFTLIESGKLDESYLRKVPGIAFYDSDGALIINERRPFPRDLDNFPRPARDIFSPEYFKHMTSLLTSRGCPFHCAFCQVSAEWRVCRYHSARYVVDEIVDICTRYPDITIFGVVDDLFVANKKRIREITALLKDAGLHGKIKFAVNGRANLITDELVESLIDMGVVEIALGLESMSPRILPLLKDQVTVEDNIKAVETIYRHGIRAGGLYMIGTPSETLEDIEATFNYVQENRHKIGGMQICVTTPLPNTPLWDMSVERGLINPDLSTFDWNKCNIAAEHIETNLYVGDVPVSEFKKIILKFRRLFFETAPYLRDAFIEVGRNEQHKLVGGFYQAALMERGKAAWTCGKLIGILVSSGGENNLLLEFLSGKLDDPGQSYTVTARLIDKATTAQIHSSRHSVPQNAWQSLRIDIPQIPGGMTLMLVIDSDTFIAEHEGTERTQGIAVRSIVLRRMESLRDGLDLSQFKELQSIGTEASDLDATNKTDDSLYRIECVSIIGGN